MKQSNRIARKQVVGESAFGFLFVGPPLAKLGPANRDRRNLVPGFPQRLHLTLDERIGRARILPA